MYLSVVTVFFLLFFISYIDAYITECSQEYSVTRLFLVKGITVKPVFHFKHTVPKRIKNFLNFKVFVNVDWLVLPYYA